MKKFILTGIAAIGAAVVATTLMASGVLLDDDPGLMLAPPDNVLFDVIAAPPLDLVVVELVIDTDVAEPSDLIAILLPAESERLSASFMAAKNYDLVASHLSQRTGGIGQLRPG